MNNEKLEIGQLKTTFDRINADCVRDGDDCVVPLSDVEFYADQIVNIFEIEYDEAEKLAKQLAELDKGLAK